MSTCKCHVSIVSFVNDGDRDKIVRKMDVGISKDIKTLQDFEDTVDSIKKQYADFYKDGATVVLVRPQTLRNLVSMEKWLHQNTDSDKGHICTRVFVHDKNDSSFVWPVFMQGLDVKDEKNRESMLKSCREISVSKMDGSGHDCYAEDPDVYIFRSTDDDNWIRDIWTCANDECNWCGAGKDAISDNSKESRKEEDREHALMTVCEVAKHNTESVLDMMTPAGFLRIPAQQLLTANTVQTNPGCSGCFMPIEAKTILDMKVLSLNVKKDAIYMMTE